jgi:hypothetical protein
MQRITDRHNQRPRRLEHLLAKREELHPRVEILALHQNWVDAHYEVEALVVDYVFKEAGDHLNVGKVFASHTRALGKLLGGFERHYLKSLLREIASKRAPTAPYLKDA